MILQALVKHYENLAKNEKVSREGWCMGKVSYGIDLSKEGEVKNIVSLKQPEPRGKKEIEVPSLLQVPEMVTRSSGVSANFLCDNSKYMLGIDAEGTNKRVQDCFKAAKEKHLSVLKDVEGEMAQAVRLFFENWNPEKAEECQEIKSNWEEITDGGNLVFCMGEKYAQEDVFIKTAWEQERNLGKAEHEGICLVTGKKSEISRIHKTIKGVPGAQSSGAALVSFNAQAFESYGKEQSYNAPVSKYAEFAYTTALNYLLSQKDYKILLGDSVIVFWADNGEEEYQDIFTWSVDPKEDNQETIKGIFQNLKQNKPIKVENLELNPEQKFYILCLAPNAARLSVRFFYEDSFGNMLKNISDHYQRMEIVRPSWDEEELLGVKKMLDETVNKKSKDKTPVPNMAAMVLKSILSDGRYPSSLYGNTLIRIRAEQGNITRGRAAIIKAYLIKNSKWKEGEKFMGLNEASTDTAYVLGRLFFVLESIQKESNPEIKSTIRDRYFNSACTTPVSVFPILLRLKNSHIKKLEREKAKAKEHYEKQLSGIMSMLDEFPARLSLDEQGKFALGYYHQKQKWYEKREVK